MVRGLLAAMLVAFTVCVVALAKTAPPGAAFRANRRLLIEARHWNDGDSFHVILPDQKELIFRLHFPKK